MKASRFALVLTATQILTCNGFAGAGPQSALDPYANIQAPRTKGDTVRDLTKPIKKVKTKGAATSALTAAEEPRQTLKAAESAGTQQSGVMGGARQIFQGIGAATKGAANDVLEGGRKLAGGAKTSSSWMGKNAKALGGGVKTASSKLKDGTEAVGQKVSTVPKDVGSGVKDMGGGIKTVSGKLAAMPKSMGKGLKGATTATADATKRVAGMPLALTRKLNPFHHDAPSAQQPPVETAASKDASAQTGL